jgi:hypothetical protein
MKIKRLQGYFFKSEILFGIPIPAIGKDPAHSPWPLPASWVSEEFPGGGRLLRRGGVHRDSRVCGAVSYFGDDHPGISAITTHLS